MLILAILGFGMLIGWLAHFVLGMGTKPQRAVAHRRPGRLVRRRPFRQPHRLLQSSAIQPSGLIGSFVGAIIVLLIWPAADLRVPSSPDRAVAISALARGRVAAGRQP